MKAEIIRPGQMPFSTLREGQLFYGIDGIYIKTGEVTAVVVYKQAGMMNAGEQVKMTPQHVVIRVAEVSFVLG